MSTDDDGKQRGSFKQFCSEASSGWFLFSGGVVAGLAGMKTIALWAGKYAEWGASDWILSVVVAVLYGAIPLAMNWYATKEDKPDEQRESSE